MLFSNLLRAPLLRASLGTAAVTAALLCFSGCQPQSTHPGQISRFDGVAFDSLTLTHGALTALRTPIANTYPQLVPSYNRVADAYAHAVAIYGLYRTNGTTEVNATLALSELVSTFGLLESDIETSFQIQIHSRKIRAASHKLAAHSSGPFSIDNLFTELQLAAAVAAAVSGNQAQVQAAGVILAATHEAIAEWQAAQGQPINLGLLGNLAPVAVAAAE